MKKFEITTAILSLVALVLNFLFAPNFSYPTLIAIIVQPAVYFIFGFAVLNNVQIRGIFKKDSYRKISKMRMFGAVLLGIALAITIYGIFFRILILPFGMFLSFFGLSCLSIIAIIAIIKYGKTESPFYKGVITRIIIIGGLGLFLCAFSPYTLVDIKYRNYPEYAEALKNTLSFPSDMTAEEKIKLERKASAERYKMKYGEYRELEEWEKMIYGDDEDEDDISLPKEEPN